MLLRHYFRLKRSKFIQEGGRSCELLLKKCEGIKKNLKVFCNQNIEIVNYHVISFVIWSVDLQFERHIRYLL